jgi:hypothetical protein
MSAAPIVISSDEEEPDTPLQALCEHNQHRSCPFPSKDLSDSKMEWEAAIDHVENLCRRNGQVPPDCAQYIASLREAYLA